MERIKGIVKNLILIILVAAMTLSDTATVFASTECSTKDSQLIQYYKIAASSLDIDEKDQEYIKGDIKLINTDLVENPTKWTLSINGTKIKTLSAASSSSPITYVYQPADNYYYTFTFIPSTGKLTYYHKTSTTYTKTSVITVEIDEGVQKLYFQADANDSGSYSDTREAEKNSLGYFDFGTYTFTIDGQTLSFSIKINSNTNKLIITRNGKEYSYDIDASEEYQTLYCEDLVPAQEIDMDYMASSLTKYNYATAKTVHYDEDDIDDALSGQKYTLTLKNNKTGKTTTAQVQTYIGYWK